MGTIADLLNTAMRDFQRYTGDGLPNEPAGRPLPVGDPASGQFNPPKKQVRDAFLAIAGAADDLTDAVEGAAADRVQTGLDLEATQANVAASLTYRDQAQVAAIAAGAPLVTTLSDPVPADGTVEIVQTDAGAQVWQVGSSEWGIVGWLTRPQFDIIAQMGAASGFIDGQEVEVNGERFTYIAGSVLPVDGERIVDAEGMGDDPATRGRLVSLGRFLPSVAEVLDSDPRTFASGTRIFTPDGDLVTTDGAGNVVSDAGQGFFVQRLASGPYNVRSFGARGLSDTKDTYAFQTALDTGEKVIADPAKSYHIGETLKIKGQGQALFGAGYYTAASQLVWVGDAGKNFVELNSRRRDDASGAFSLTGGQFGGFYMTQAGTESRCDNFVWVEDGCFHGLVQDLYLRTGEGLAPQKSFIQVGADQDLSYVVHMMFRNIIARSDVQALPGTPDPAPIGMHVNSAIESDFENVYMYDMQDCWVIGNSDPTKFRNVETISLRHCMGETGDRDLVTDQASGLKIYNATGMDISGGSKFSAAATGGGGASADYANARPIRLMAPVNGPIQALHIADSLIWGFGSRSDYLIEAELNAVVLQSSIRSTEFRDAKLGVLLASAGSAVDFEIDEQSCTYRRVPSTGAKFRVQGERTALATYTAGSLTKREIDQVQKRSSTAPTLAASVQNDAQPLVVQAYEKGNDLAAAEVAIFNAGATDVTASSGNFIRFREFGPEEITGRTRKSANPGTIASGAGYYTPGTMPGAQVGDFFVASFYDGTGDGQAGCLVSAYCSIPDRIEFAVLNLTGASVTLQSGTFEAVRLNPAMADFYGSATFDADSVAANSVAVLSVAATEQEVFALGVSPGDFVAVSCSIDQNDLSAFGVVTSSNEVKIVAMNGKGSAIDLAEAEWRVLVYDVPTVG